MLNILRRCVTEKEDNVTGDRTDSVTENEENSNPNSDQTVTRYAVRS